MLKIYSKLKLSRTTLFDLICMYLSNQIPCLMTFIEDHAVISILWPVRYQYSGLYILYHGLSIDLLIVW